MIDDVRFFATAARGTEAALFDEISAMGLSSPQVERGGVSFEGGLAAAYRACLWSRVASRVLLPLASFEATDGDTLYDGVVEISWIDHLGPRQTLAVSVAGESSSPGLNNTRFAAQRTKDAIVDRIREATGMRPTVDLKEPDLRINVHLRGTTATLSLDLSGDGLHHRGIGREGAAAPLKENLAAALLMLAGWPGMIQDALAAGRATSGSAEGPTLVDPLCGSGTILIEAGWMALDVAPGLQRDKHGFEGWRGHDEGLWRELLAEARAREVAGRGRGVRLCGGDQAERTLKTARRNIQRAGLGGRVTLEQRPLHEFKAPPTAGGSPRGLILTNPPYGERLGESGELGPLYEQLGDLFRRGFPGWRACVLTGNRALANQIGLKATERHPVFNGPIECRLLVYPISEEAVQSEEGPGWRKPGPDAPMLENRLKKNLRKIKAWRAREGIDCYRIYDADIPEYNVAIDWYDGAVHVQEYAPPYKVDPRVAEAHLRDVMLVVPEVLGVAPEEVSLKVRRRGEGGAQYGKVAQMGALREVREGGLRFLVNMTDYLDTGLFLDGRIQRSMIRELASGRDFLNLFAYTCTASVYAADGGARSTTSVDLSGTYLSWGRQNLALNGFDDSRHQTVRGDVMSGLRSSSRRYGLIFVAPPTFSRSKSTQQTFDVLHHHGALLHMAARLLTEDGVLIFSNAHQSFEIDPRLEKSFNLEEITAQTIPWDFERRPQIHNTWRLTLKG